MFTWAYIYHCPELDWDKDRDEKTAGGFRILLVPAADLDSAVLAAKHLVAEQGVSSIELCGYFGVTGTSRVLDAIGGAAPVGNVMFGAESLFSAAAAFSGS